MTLFWTGLSLAFLLWFLLVVLFTPRIDYRLTAPLRLDSPDFLRVIQATCQAAVHGRNTVEILTNGSSFYPAMRDAIRQAEASINLEAYIFIPGTAAGMLIESLVERARAGVHVRLVLDSIGSATLDHATVGRLRDAGCQVHFYQPFVWYRLHRLNNRTHRELLIVDGRVAIAGGAGVADWWLIPSNGKPPWRDTMARIEGPIVGALQGVFAENWLECCGEILTSPHDWPEIGPAGTTGAMIVKSSPADRATSSRVVFQMLIEGSAARIDISTPYFLPDRALRRAIISAASRGVRVRVLVPGAGSDQQLVRLASRRLYGEMLDAGVRIFEYRPSMLHAKVLLVDNDWAIIGTTNMDNRSFEHNDEVNVAFREPAVTGRLCDDFNDDLKSSEEITPERWRGRSVLERLVEPIAWLLERQQ